MHKYEGYSKSSKTNSRNTLFSYEIYKIIFLHSFHPIHNTSVSNVSIENSVLEFFDGNIAYELDGNYVEK